MVIFKEGHYMIDNLYSDIDFTNGKALYVVPDNSELAYKIQALGIVDFVLNDDGNLIDVEAKPISVDPTEKIKTQLNEIDLATIAPLRAILAGQSTEENQQKLIQLEKEATSLRKQLQKLEDKTTNIRDEFLNIETIDKEDSLWQ